ncbi:MAG: MFS transporter [Gemmatimonadota bacterium]
MTDRGGESRSAVSALLLLSVAVVLGLSVWFAASAAAPRLQLRWGLDATRAGWLTSLVQLGFVAGTLTAAVFNLADIVPARRYFSTSTAAAALTNAALLAVPDYRWALVSRFATGFFLAGVYPPAMKMAATWFRERRGLAIGTVVGALTLGKSTPYLVDALGGAGIGWIVLSTSACGILGAALVAIGYRDGPHAFPRRPFSWRLVGDVVRCRKWRLATGGYLGHMWELYAFWTWIAAWLVASSNSRAALPAETPGGTGAKLAAFAAIAIGAAGCIWGGRVADRIGYGPLTIRAMLVSGSCALLAGFLYGASFMLLLPLILVWGFFVIADSAQFSALVTEVVEPHAVGTALTLQVSLGFLLTTATIQLVPWLSSLIGWRWSFAVLAVGPALGIASIRSLSDTEPFRARGRWRR